MIRKFIAPLILVSQLFNLTTFAGPTFGEKIKVAFEGVNPLDIFVGKKTDQILNLNESEQHTLRKIYSNDQRIMVNESKSALTSYFFEKIYYRERRVLETAEINSLQTQDEILKKYIGLKSKNFDGLKFLDLEDLITIFSNKKWSIEMKKGLLQA